MERYVAANLSWKDWWSLKVVSYFVWRLSYLRCSFQEFEFSKSVIWIYRMYFFPNCFFTDMTNTELCISLVFGFQGLIIFHLSSGKKKKEGERRLNFSLGNVPRCFICPNKQVDCTWQWCSLASCQRGFPGINLIYLGAHLKIWSVLCDFNLKCNRKMMRDIFQVPLKALLWEHSSVLLVALHRWLLVPSAS